MDFSSVPRALDSLQRRQPPLPDAVRLLAEKLRAPLEGPLLGDPAKDGDASLFHQHLEQLLLPYRGENNDGLDGSDPDSAPRWEPLAVGLFVATQLLEQFAAGAVADAGGDGGVPAVYPEGPRVPEEAPVEEEGADGSAGSALPLPPLPADGAATAGLSRLLHAVALRHMEHPEPRVRTYVARAVGAYCRAVLILSMVAGVDDGAEAAASPLRTMPREIQARLLASIARHLVEGRPEQPPGEAAAEGTKAVTEATEKESQGAAPQRSAQEHLQFSRDSSGALDDTTGWRALETNWQCLAALVSALGPAYVAEFGFPDDVLAQCRHCAVKHKNRHVRAAAMAVLERAVVATAAAAARPEGAERAEALLYRRDGLLRRTVALVLKTGLADNWSQVRMAASVLCRVLFLTLQDRGEGGVEDLYPTLLPRMCLNRFYLAQGVKLYSHQTWKLVVKDSGLALVATHLPAVCQYYVQMADADNHVVREAACQAIAELATKLGSLSVEYHDRLTGHLDMLIQALLMCFHDESWPVRDEACLACGLLCKAYPDECRSELNVLWERWTEQLTDQIWSVREDAAVALGDALEAYGVEFLDKLRALVKKILPAAKDQPAMTQEAFKAHQNDFEMHTDSQLYSCGSLAPKLRKGGAGRIGCSTCGIDRPKAPWEATDGCIYLIREICVRCCSEDKVGTPMELKDDELLPLMRDLADVCRVQHFPQSSELRATLWRQLPAMAHAIGKNRFKKLYLEIFMDLMFANLESKSASQLSVHAAGQCAEDLAQFVGLSIFRGRLEEYQQEVFDKVMKERQMMPKGPAVLADGTIAPFSPYGPPGLLDSVHMPSSAVK